MPKKPNRQQPRARRQTAADQRWIAELLDAMRGRHIAVIGDLMLDEWYWGNVRRISPEAPVPVVEVMDHTYTLGGAGNVANNLAALGAKVSVFGVIGDDDAGSKVLQLFRKLSIDTKGVARVGGRPTTQKMRIVAHNQQVVRADCESTDAIDGRVELTLRRELAALDGSLDGAVLSDYGKGLISGPIVRSVRSFKQKAVITADPKPENIDAFADVDCIAPNAAEAQSAAGMPLTSETDLSRAGAALLERTRARYVLITQGEHGMTLFARGKRPFTVPAVARQVYDVSGAGDTVMSMLTLALSIGAPVERAVVLANVAAGVVVEKLGTATAAPDEILRFAMMEGIHAPVPADDRHARR
ncbi:MAG: bifunctional heptose 7-phosphate kinase/heptose 1-phosphate adenyltransferase [Candidatus Eremiobacter antarcticus]|nr:bifunctional hydroxymethylpyrimidine kinase/phosphomethylpyrimidine kinase [Candidatus Eremiobacteraeota bacterium]MBC5808221.1 bifunctional hydroxymethylpyrimidine kinase/phosphomethylpyrimidine kinase [Candidatus Eremiobacteraeota bacterium]